MTTIPLYWLDDGKLYVRKGYANSGETVSINGVEYNVTQYSSGDGWLCERIDQ